MHHEISKFRDRLGEALAEMDALSKLLDGSAVQ